MQAAHPTASTVPVTIECAFPNSQLLMQQLPLHGITAVWLSRRALHGVIFFCRIRRTCRAESGWSCCHQSTQASRRSSGAATVSGPSCASSPRRALPATARLAQLELTGHFPKQVIWSAALHELCTQGSMSIKVMHALGTPPMAGSPLAHACVCAVGLMSPEKQCWTALLL